MNSEELANNGNSGGVEITALYASAMASGDRPIPDTLSVGFGYSYPFGAGCVPYEYSKTHVLAEHFWPWDWEM